ncbi:MAG TPA: hypothetical protein VF053_01210 [Streptosporangiales bacterium]
MSSDDEQPPARRAEHALPWIGVDDLSPAQVEMLQATDDARRAGHISADDAAAIERVIRDGHPHGARKRLAEAKRRNGSSNAAT